MFNKAEMNKFRVIANKLDDEYKSNHCDVQAHYHDNFLGNCGQACHELEAELANAFNEGEQNV